jgi:hypothetical protein
MNERTDRGKLGGAQRLMGEWGGGGGPARMEMQAPTPSRASACM